MAGNILVKIKKAFMNPGKVYTLIGRESKELFLWDHYYAALRDPKIKAGVSYSVRWDEIVEGLKAGGLNIVDFKIDVDDYKSYIKAAEYRRFPDYTRWINFFEKSLEHYLAAKVLALSGRDIYIDVANARSPVPEIYHKLYGSRTYGQDIVFPEGIRENIIGGDACNMPVEDGFATKMALHCSFEHFEEDSDIKFVGEANRVLRKGGKLCIVPLYLANNYMIVTDPAVLPKGGISFESDAILYCRRWWRNRYGRIYDIPHFISRIKNNLNGLKLTIYVIQNAKEIDEFCYVKLIALFEKS